MYKIVNKKQFYTTVTLMDIEAPFVARKAEAGQFIILRVDEDGERIPLTVAGYDREKGTVRIIFQIVGATTEKLNHKNIGDSLQDFVGPLGVATKLDGLKKVCVVGGGVGCAIALPVASKLHNLGADVTSIIGFRNQDLVILEDEFKSISNKTPNPLIKSTTVGLDVNSKGGIIVEETTGKTSKDGVFAGGDAVTGAATVISAMGAGKIAAKAIDEYLNER